MRITMKPQKTNTFSVYGILTIRFVNWFLSFETTVSISVWENQCTLVSKEREDRNQFCNSLRNPKLHLVITLLPSEHEKDRVVTMNNNRPKGLLIHQRFFNKDSDVIVEYTLLLDKGKPCVTYKNTFFCVNDVCRIIQNSIQRVVINCVAIRSMHSFSQCDFVSTEQDVEMTHQIQQQQHITTDLTGIVRNDNYLPSQLETMTANNSNTCGFGNVGSENHINGWICY